MPADAQGGRVSVTAKLKCRHKGDVCKLLTAKNCVGYVGLWRVSRNFFHNFPYIGTLYKNPTHPTHLTFSTVQIIDRQALVQLWRILSTRHKPDTTRHNPSLRFFNVLGLLIMVFAAFMASTATNRWLTPIHPVQYGHQRCLRGSVLIPPPPPRQPVKSLRPEAPRQALAFSRPLPPWVCDHGSSSNLPSPPASLGTHPAPLPSVWSPPGAGGPGLFCRWWRL
jgi:hypothetical protein